ncbi:MAG: hypothetical protein L0H19_04915 [Salinisphaera sp.]|nr:hypothetical protein [Salinisphaera sp.]
MALDQTFAMDDTGFATLTARLCAVAEEYAGGRLVVVLEGGYNAEALAASSRAVVRALAGRPGDMVNVLKEDPGLPAVVAARMFHGF